MDDVASTADSGDFDDTHDAGYTAPAGEKSVDAPAAETNAAEGAYWRENVRLLVSLMVIWFAVSYGAGILFRDFLDQFMLGGYPLGFWFAQQGSIYVFIALIFFYVVRMKQIERKYDLDD
ncbi:sodium:solute symporter [Erythrobacter sp. KY5]|uniref:DUF4212 domain-containing protein n=1 Tax=Erythrobacter sp. KY5 TaxID=2011159 RepID=UPI000DBF31D4|nr:DUF4212 domain-containing protein [Erythrobacter sp. KY5]AWW73763.1 sodium:solute symporter [Erythrobacter sp. KY5]